MERHPEEIGNLRPLQDAAVMTVAGTAVIMIVSKGQPGPMVDVLFAGVVLGVWATMTRGRWGGGGYAVRLIMCYVGVALISGASMVEEAGTFNDDAFRRAVERAGATEAIDGVLADLAREERTAELGRLVTAGLRRLNAEDHLRRIELRRVMLDAMSEAECAAHWWGTPSRDSTRQILQSLPSEQADGWMDVMVSAIVAEVRGSPPVHHVTDKEYDTAYDWLFDEVPSVEQATFLKVEGRLVDAASGDADPDPTDACWFIRRYYDAVIAASHGSHPNAAAIVGVFEIQP